MDSLSIVIWEQLEATSDLLEKNVCYYLHYYQPKEGFVDFSQHKKYQHFYAEISASHCEKG